LLYVLLILSLNYNFKIKKNFFLNFYILEIVIEHLLISALYVFIRLCDNFFRISLDVNSGKIVKILRIPTTDFTSTSPVNVTFGLNAQLETEAVPVSYGFIGDFKSLELNSERYYEFSNDQELWRYNKNLK
jgi:hypothetical protein